MALRFISTQEEWLGERINGILHGKHIEQHWTESQLTAIGLEVFDPGEPVITPDPSTTGSFSAFVDLLTAQEYTDIVTETLTDVPIKEWWDYILGSGAVDLADADFLAGMALCVTAGIFTQTRSDEITGSTFT